MKIINPLEITPSMVVTTAVETYSNWSSATTYSVGNKVIYNYRVWQSVINSNTNITPGTDATKWLDVAPSNKIAAFDTSYSTKTTGTSPLSFDITVNKMFNSCAILGIEAANSLVITQTTVAEGVVYTKTVNLDGAIIIDWYDYFFTPFDSLENVVITDIPPYSLSTLSIELIGTSSPLVGVIIIGSVFDIGGTQYGVNFGIKDYSVKEENEFGDIVFVERNYARRVEPTVFVENTALRKIDKLLTGIRAKPTVFIPTEAEGYDPLITFGFLSDWNIEIPYPQNSLLRLDIKGLT